MVKYVLVGLLLVLAPLGWGLASVILVTAKVDAPLKIAVGSHEKCLFNPRWNSLNGYYAFESMQVHLLREGQPPQELDFTVENKPWENEISPDGMIDEKRFYFSVDIHLPDDPELVGAGTIQVQGALIAPVKSQQFGYFEEEKRDINLSRPIDVSDSVAAVRWKRWTAYGSAALGLLLILTGLVKMVISNSRGMRYAPDDTPKRSDFNLPP